MTATAIVSALMSVVLLIAIYLSLRSQESYWNSNEDKK